MRRITPSLAENYPHKIYNDNNCIRFLEKISCTQITVPDNAIDKSESLLKNFLTRTGLLTIVPVFAEELRLPSMKDITMYSIASRIICRSCKKICEPPVQGCLECGSIICQSCLYKSSMLRVEGIIYSACHDGVGHLLEHGELKELTDILNGLAFNCYCGKAVNGHKEMRNHTTCFKQIPSEVTELRICEFCQEVQDAIEYEEHVLDQHFIRRNEGFNADPLQRETLFNAKIMLPLRRNNEAWVFDAIVVTNIFEDSLGVFKLHQIKVLPDTMIWIVSFTQEPEAGYKSEDFVADLYFEGVLKQEKYRKFCLARVYPLGIHMTEEEFLTYTALALPDCYTTSFPDPRKMEAHVEVTIRTAAGGYNLVQPHGYKEILTNKVEA